MATTTGGTDVDDDAFDADDDRYDTLVLPPDVQQAIDQVRLLYFVFFLYFRLNIIIVCVYIDITKYRRN
jgi:hypothetical protein